MEYAQYLRFLPARYRTEAIVEPTSTWWSWGGHQVHIARVPAPEAPVRVLAVHGVGGHAGLVWPLATSVAGDAEVLAVDLPLYGQTRTSESGMVRYPHWIDLLSELVRGEREHDERPLVLFGASMGGMLSYEVAARTGQVDHVVATCLLDPSDPQARAAGARWPWLGRCAPPILRVLEPVLGGLRLPLRWQVDLADMSANPELNRVCAADRAGGGVQLPLGFLGSYLNFRHTEPETFTATPVTLVHPEQDRWTPPRLSMDFLERIAAPTESVLLAGCGHFPVEQPGVDQLVVAARAVCDAVAA